MMSEFHFAFKLLSCLIKHINLNKTTAVHATCSANRFSGNNNGQLENENTLEAKMVFARWQLICQSNSG
jgi:hypothetical protein